MALAVFVGFSLLNISGTGGTLRSYGRLAHEMRAFAESGRGLAWHSTRDIPLPVVDALEPLWTVAGLVMIVAAVRFFFHYRRANRIGSAA